ncbi:MAG: asparagine synthetase B [Flavobacterium sp.]|nr:MAG: asparagine synthetase B [Flavobacterium sp.]
MKKITTIAFAFLIVLSTSMTAQEFSELNKSSMDIAAYPTSYKDANKQMKIIYSRPQLKGRSLSKLAPNGKVWRTGANEATELVLYTDYTLGAKTLKAGTYTLATIPGEKEWTIIINSDLNTWGSYYYNEKNDVARIKVPVKTANESLEAFSIALADDGNKGVTMHLGWDKVRVAVPFVKANY